MKYILLMIYPTASWNEVENRRKFFEKYAKANDFDFKIPENWYFQPTEKIMATKVDLISFFLLFISCISYCILYCSDLFTSGGT